MRKLLTGPGTRITYPLIAALFPLGMRLLMLPSLPIPSPAIHDEFSYLLAGDTFSLGRITNPWHPLWEHFESFHILQQPTYMSMYPPMQGLFLALGKVLFGHPWWGVFLSVCLLCLAVYWMLQAWLRPRWALGGSLATALFAGGTHYWMNSYWGGAAAAIGGCLVLGAFARLEEPGARHPSLNAVLMAIGIGILANSRPWEGLLFCLPIVAVFLRSVVVGNRMTLRARLSRVLLPWCLVLFVIALSMMYYCRRITGNPFLLPYLHQSNTYVATPLFLWQSPKPTPHYNHAAMARYYLEWEPRFQNAGNIQSLADWVKTMECHFQDARIFFLSALSAFILLAALSRDRRARLLLVPLGAIVAGTCLQRYFQFHYAAPAFGLLVAAHFMALSKLSAMRFKGREIGRGFAVATVLITCLMLLYLNLRRVGRPLLEFSEQRARMARLLESSPGRHLVLVRYSPAHDPLREWVYNGADLEHGKVVWARAMSEDKDKQVLRYYQGRQIWLLEPDSSPLRLQPIP